MSAQSRITPANPAFAALSLLLNEKLSNWGISTGDRLIVACSGGCDSMVLLHLLAENGFNAEVAHVNYQLRGLESQHDEDLVRETAERLNLPFHHANGRDAIPPKGNNLQEHARRFRYAFFERLMQERKARATLTAHHQDDVAETFLLNLLRGAGLNGLSGIPEQNNGVLRPLLAASKQTLLKAAVEMGIRWREDGSNAETKYRRNQIRHDWLSKLRQLDPDIVEKLAKTAIRMKKTADVVEELLEREKPSRPLPENAAFEVAIGRIAESAQPETLLFLFVRRFGFSATQCAEATQNHTPSRGKHWKSASHTLWRKKGYFTVYQGI
jgi:tRNA(Ile)-lysidine synthase